MMEIVMDFFFLILDIALFTGCAVIVLHMLPQKAEAPFWKRLLLWGTFAALTVLLPNLFRDDVITMVTLTALYLLIGWFLYHRSRVGLLYQLIYMAVMYATQALAIFGVLHLWSHTDFDVQTYSRLVVLFKQAFLILAVIIMGMILSRRYVSDSRALKLRGMVIVPLLSTVLIFLYVLSSEVFIARYGYAGLIVFCIMVLVINFYCLHFWYDVAANQELRHRLELTQAQNELTCQYYRDLEESYSKSRKVIHDIRNHMQAMEQAVRLDESRDYFSDVHEMLNSLGMKFYSDNRMLNIILNDKLKGLREEQAECSLGGIDIGFLSDIDITTIFANLLDNAIEAGEGQESFWLKIRGEQIQDFTLVKIWNSCRAGEKKKGHEGLGLDNVRQALEKYHGELTAEQADGVFSVTVVFPGQG